MNTVLGKTIDRVPQNTAATVNARIELDMRRRLGHYARNPEQIRARLSELDREWDIERVLETNASALALGGLVAGVVADRRALLLSGAVLAFLLQHAVQGWCPPVPVLRRLGVRTAGEIETERQCLKAISRRCAATTTASAVSPAPGRFLPPSARAMPCCTEPMPDWRNGRSAGSNGKVEPQCRRTTQKAAKPSVVSWTAGRFELTR